MSRKRPNIGVTGPDKGGLAAWWFSKLALTLQGGRAVRIRPKDGIPQTNLHGLIIGGGADIHPKYYDGKEIQELFAKEEKVSGIRAFFFRFVTLLFSPIIFFVRKVLSTGSTGVDVRRDELEFQLLEHALHNEIPVLGICRGAQLINIHRGGTLHSDIANFYTEIPRVNSIWPKKKVSIKKGSTLYRIIGHRELSVNALHKQAVDELGEGLEIVAREENGLVQAIEHAGNSFLLGVQWHPEYMPQLPPQRRIFKALVKEARRCKGESAEPVNPTDQRES